MRHHRLQHHADNLCQMFCGWQLMHDWGVLTKLRSGTLTIDVLSGGCRHNGELIPELAMVNILGSWLRKDLADHSIPLDALVQASLEVSFATEELPEQKDKSHQFAEPWPPFISCTIQCRSQVATADEVCLSEYDDYEEWPKHLAC